MNLKNVVIPSVIMFSVFVKFSFSQDSLKLVATIQGEKIGDQFSVVAGVGDVNGDGYDDFVVGAPGGNYAKLYFGGSPFDTVADLRFRSTGQWDRFGAALVGNEDLNGDGFNDFVIGVPGYGEFMHGRAYVYFGGTQMDTIPDLILEEFGYYYSFGSSISMAGDVNNDGFEDLIVGAPDDDYDGRGRAYIYFGGEEMDNVSDVYLEGQESSDLFGTSVSGVGDVNKDNFDDLLIGAPQDLKGGAGKAYLIYGGANISLNNSVAFLNDSSMAYDAFGRVVCSLRDINKDSYSDFAILSLGRIDIYFGAKEISTIPNFSLLSEESFGFVGGIDDLNNDGYDDMVAVSENVSLYFGNSDFDTTTDISLDFWATPVSYIGNINGDSIKELGFGISGGWDPKGHVNIYSYDIIDFIEDNGINISSKQFRLFHNYPNPFNGITNIKYELYKTAQVTLQIFDTKGCLIKNINLGVQPSGLHIYKWNGKSNSSNEISSGIYYLRLKVQLRNPRNPIYSKMQKLVFIK